MEKSIFEMELSIKEKLNNKFKTDNEKMYFLIHEIAILKKSDDLAYDFEKFLQKLK